MGGHRGRAGNLGRRLAGRRGGHSGRGVLLAALQISQVRSQRRETAELEFMHDLQTPATYQAFRTVLLIAEDSKADQVRALGREVREAVATASWA